MASRHTIGAMQPDGTVVPEATFDVEHVANTIVHIASLPPDVTMLEVNIMYVLSQPHVQMPIDPLSLGQHRHHMSEEVNGNGGIICASKDHPKGSFVAPE